MKEKRRMVLNVVLALILGLSLVFLMGASGGKTPPEGFTQDAANPLEGSNRER